MGNDKVKVTRMAVEPFREAFNKMLDDDYKKGLREQKRSSKVTKIIKDEETIQTTLGLDFM